MIPSSKTRPLGWLSLFLAALLSVLSAACARQPQNEKAAGPTPQTANTAASPIPWRTIEPPVRLDTSEAQTKPQKPQPPVIKNFSGTGVVTLINSKEGWLEINHEEIEGLMPAMLMQWSVKDRAMLKSIRVGDKVDFTVQDNNGSELIIELKKSAAQ